MNVDLNCMYLFIYIYLKFHDGKSQVIPLKRLAYLLLEIESEISKVSNNPNKSDCHKQQINFKDRNQIEHI